MDGFEGLAALCFVWSTIQIPGSLSLSLPLIMMIVCMENEYSVLTFAIADFHSTHLYFWEALTDLSTYIVYRFEYSWCSEKHWGT